MFDVNEWIVPHLRDAKMYTQTLGDIWDAKPELARMCLNENPLPPSQGVLDALVEGGKLGNRYPGVCMDLRTQIGDMFGLPPQRVFLGNGSSETIDSMMRAFLNPGDEVILPTPTFSLFAARASVVGAKVVDVEFTEGDIEYRLQSYLDAITDKTKLILVVTPNNPTGSFFGEAELRTLLDKGIPTCIDEAYLEFHPDMPNMAHLVAEYPNAFVSHTLSKAYGLAGIRFGYVLAQEPMIEIFEKLALPWNLGFPAVKVASVALAEKETLQRNIDYMNKWMGEFAKVLVELGMTPVHPAGNFMLVDANGTGKTSQEIFEAGLEAGVMLKAVGTVHGKNGYFRVTPGSVAENERVIAFFKSFFS